MKVVELYVIHDELYGIRTCCYLDLTTTQNSKPPFITRVCHESREVAFETGNFTDSEIEERLQCTELQNLPLWFDPTHRIVAWYWAPDLGIRVDGHDERQPEIMSYFLWHVAQALNALILARRLYTFKYLDGPGYAAFLDEDNLSAISRWKDWLVCIKIVPMHLTPDEAFKSNLFGLTGEEPIQLVNPADTKRRRRFQQHSNTEDQEAQDFIIIKDSSKLQTELEKRKQGLQATWRHWFVMCRRSQHTETWWSNSMEDV
jgi:hypothetical protein